MSTNSARSEIFKILCNKAIFPSGYSGYSWDYAKIIKSNLSINVINSVKDIDNSIREALETVDGYTYSNGTQCFPRMRMKKTKVNKSNNLNDYNILYEVI